MIVRNQKGIALVMVLVLAIIGLAIVSSLLFMVTQGTKLSAAQKFYRTAEEASLGAVEISADYLSGRGRLALAIMEGTAYGSGCFCGSRTNPDDNIDRNAGNIRTCRCDKLCSPTVDWTICSTDDMDLNPTVNPDFTLKLMGTPDDYTVAVKIVDTVLGNTEMDGLGVDLIGTGVVEADANTSRSQHNPYLYRFDIQADSSGKTTERSRVSVLYAY
jgi:hypothetical protein